MIRKIHPFAVFWHPEQENEVLAEMHPAMAQRYSRTIDHIVAEATGHFVIMNQFATDLDSAIEAAYGIHDREYVRRLVEDYTNENWFGESVEALARLALQSVGATVAAAREIIKGSHSLVYSVAAGQHHARFNEGAGFCALNDIVVAAQEFRAAGLKPIIIDIDIHAGDGTQAMLWESDIPTVSVHIGLTYPMDRMTSNHDRGTERHTFHWPENHAYNFALPHYASDDALAWAADGIDDIIRREKPDVVIFVAGADGHQGTQEANLMDTGFGSYTYAGFDTFAGRVRGWADELTGGRILMTGAGGYQGLDHTPRIWANMIQVLAGLR